MAGLCCSIALYTVLPTEMVYSLADGYPSKYSPGSLYIVTTLIETITLPLIHTTT